MSGKLEGSAIFLVILMVLFITSQIANASTAYNVGDSDGWTLGVSNWPNGKNFKAGDVLVFKYPKGVHNVVIVNKANYDNCNASGKTLTSGNDRITLKKGDAYFICGIAGHCDGGQKIAVTAN
ncbi:basic blue protein-like [Lycium ferocissimum]|uniref:basic blue protein-like n=1 Tax=Lycium ferocissimum TaxID=112874 RepID=UPI002814AEDF|nr:basic blue protein-like [Lycium ferocissimum]